MDNVGDLIGDVDNVDDLLIGSGWTRSDLLMEGYSKGAHVGDRLLEGCWRDAGEGTGSIHRAYSCEHC